MAEELYDMIVPPGVPRSVIRDVMSKFDVEVVKRVRPLKFANMDGDERPLLAFRGKREVVEEVEAYVYEWLRRYVSDEDEPSPEPEKPAT